MKSVDRCLAEHTVPPAVWLQTQETGRRIAACYIRIQNVVIVVLDYARDRPTLFTHSCGSHLSKS